MIPLLVVVGRLWLSRLIHIIDCTLSVKGGLMLKVLSLLTMS